MSRTAENDTDAELQRKIASALRIGIPAAVVVAAVIAGIVQGAGGAILLLAAAALVAAIAIFWASLRTLVGETPLSGADAYALGAPRAEEEQKRAVLRALKDLEFERGVGKISNEDYELLTAKYRSEAKRLLRLLDEEAQPRRERVEALVLRRLRKAGLVEDAAAGERAGAHTRRSGKRAARRGAPRAMPVPEESSRPAGPVDAVTESPAGEASAATPKTLDSIPPLRNKEAIPTADPGRACAECGTVNDADAVFCKKCGARRAHPEPAGAGSPSDANDESEAPT